MKNLFRSLAAAALLALAAAPVACTADVGDASSETHDATAASGRFETFKGDDGLHYFQLFASNGEELLRSDGYKSLSSAKSGIGSAKSNAASATRFELLETDGAEWYFKLTATNGRLLAVGQTYSTKTDAERGISAAMKAAKNASTTAATAGGPKLEVFKGGDGRWYFHLRAANGQIVVQSQGYTTKSGAQNGTVSVETNGVDASNFEIAEGADGQHYFRLRAGNHKIIARSQMYATKSGAIHGAAVVRAILLEMTGAGVVSDDTIQAEIEKATDGLTFTSESDYPFHYVHAALAAGAAIDEAAVRSAFAPEVDADSAADKPMASLYAMEATWDDWKAANHECADPNDEAALPNCEKMRDLEQVLESNLTDIHVYFFGANGSPGHVDGIGVSVFLVGRSPEGNLVGVRTVAIWT